MNEVSVELNVAFYMILCWLEDLICCKRRYWIEAPSRGLRILGSGLQRLGSVQEFKVEHG